VAFSSLFLVLVSRSTIQYPLHLIIHSQECYIVHPWEATFLKYHEGITRFSHTFTSAMQQRPCQGSSLFPQHLSFTSGKLILQQLIDTSQISNLPCGFAQCTRCCMRLVRLLRNLSNFLPRNPIAAERVLLWDGKHEKKSHTIEPAL
jgi:hypothetical protein